MIRFPRQQRLLTGRFDAIPFLAVGLLLVVFLFFHTSLVYLPGLPVLLDADQLGAKMPQPLKITLDEQSRLRFRGAEFANVEMLAARLRAEAKTNRTAYGLKIEAHPQATNSAVRQLVQVARELNWPLDLPGGRLDLPESGSLVLATNPVITLAINLSGQIYFESQVVPEERVRERLAAKVQQSRQPLTLVLLADKAVEYDLVVRVGAAARSAGIRQVVLATRPAMFHSRLLP